MVVRLTSNSQGQRHGTEIDPGFEGTNRRNRTQIKSPEALIRESKEPYMTPWDVQGAKEKERKK